MCRPRPTSVLHDDSGGGDDDDDDDVWCVRFLRCVDVEGKNVSRSGGGRWGLYPFSIGFSGVIQGKATYNGGVGKFM